MSSLIRSLMIKVGADFSDLKSNMASAAAAMKNGFGDMDLSKTNDALKGLGQSVKLTESEFKAATAGMDDWRTNADGLKARITYLNDVIDDQKVSLDGLNHKLELTSQQYGEDSSKATALKIAINNQNAKLKESESELTKVTGKLDNFGKETDQAADKSGLLGKIFAGGFFANIASNALSNIGNKLKELASKAFETADNLMSLSSQTGQSTTKLQEMQYISDDLGVSMDTQAAALKRLINNMSEAKAGSGPAYEAFKKLRVNAVDPLTGSLRDSNEVYDEVIDALGEMTNETERNAVAQDLLGKSATDLNPLIEAGSDALNDMADEARTTGAVMSKDAVKALDAAGDSMDHLKQKTIALVGEGLAAIISHGKTAAETLSDINDAISENTNVQDLIKQYRTLLTEIESQSLSSEDLTAKTAELEKVKQSLIKASNGVITAIDLENGSFDQQVNVLEKATEAERNAIKYKLISTALDNTGVGLTERKAKAQENYNYWQNIVNAAQDVANKQQDESNKNIDLLKNHLSEAADKLKQLAEDTVSGENAIKSLVNNGLMTADEAAATLGITLNEVNGILAQTANVSGDVSQKGNDILSSFENIDKAASKLITKYNEAYTAAYNSVDGQVKLFSDLDEKAGISIDGVIASMDKQIEYLANYNNNLKLAMQKGIDEGLISTLSDGSTQSAAILAQIVKGSQEDIAKLNESFKGVEKGKEAFATTIAQMQTDFDMTMIDIQRTLFNAVQDADKYGELYNIGANNVQAMINGINSKLGALKTAVANMNKVVVDTTEDEMEIHSPSRVMERLGEHIPEGEAKGIRNKLNLPAEAMRELDMAAKAAAAQAIGMPAFSMNLGTDDLNGLPSISNPSGAANTASFSEQEVKVSGEITVRGVNDNNELIGTTKIIAEELSRNARRFPSGMTYDLG